MLVILVFVSNVLRDMPQYNLKFYSAFFFRMHGKLAFS
ncbi:hypothetical protein VAA_04066 [Vibrio anguillarum 775]|nr:hypothetical protein VAA_04066 [Vibrio anguillarum 775]